VQVDGAPGNVDQAVDLSPDIAGGTLPFRSASFHLVTNRHESFVAAEVARVLAPGGFQARIWAVCLSLRSGAWRRPHDSWRAAAQQALL
jgi:hypothetical protein